MKKIILFLLFIIFPTYFSNASFLNDSSTYYKLHSDISSNWYMNEKSAKVLRYDPPYYAIQGNLIRETVGNPEIQCMTIIFYYDYDNQIMKCKPISLTIYDLNGNILKTNDDEYVEIMDIPPGNNGQQTNLLGSLGDFYFFACYHMFFFKNDDTSSFTLPLSTNIDFNH